MSQTQNSNLETGRQGKDRKSTQPPDSGNEGEVRIQVEKLKAGYTRLPNAILMEMIHGDLSKAEIEILLLIARLTISFIDPETGKENQRVSLSKGAIARYTGIQGKTVLKAISTLEKRGLIRKVKGNWAEKNQIGLVYPAGLFDRHSSDSASFPKDNSVRTAEVPRSNSSGLAPVQTSGGENVPRDTKGTQQKDLESTYSEDQKSTHYKQYRLNNKINSLSQTCSNCPPIQGYFKELKPQKKREGEWNHFLKLQNDFSVEEISDCLNWLRANGTPKTAEPCHSPMAYLSIAMAEVLGVVQKTKERIKNSEDQKQRMEDKQKASEEQSQTEALEFLRKTAAFEKAFPSLKAQKAHLLSFAKKYPMLNTDGPILRNLAISAWSSESKTSLQGGVT